MSTPSESQDRPRGVVVPEVALAGRAAVRSTSALGRAVVADALHAVDPVGARAAERETDWRRGYLTHFHRLVEAGLQSREAALAIARDGAGSLAARMRLTTTDGEVPLAEGLRDLPAADRFSTVTVAGTGVPERELTVPLHGRRIQGAELLHQLDDWVEAGTMEPSFAEAVAAVVDRPEWLPLDGRKVVVLGAGAEMGPLTSLLRWGADVVALDLPRPQVWRQVLDTARRHAGRVHLPVEHLGSAAESELPERAGADLVHDLPDVARWLGQTEGPLVLGNYVYADGAANLRVSTAVDALTAHLTARRDDVSLSFLATPTDVFAVPGEVVQEAERRYRAPGLTTAVRRPLRVVSGGRLLRRNYAPGADPGITDALVPQQGPNYTLAKRLQRWRATVARDAGLPVSFTVAPPTRTRSVVRNRALAAAYAGAGRFGVEVFEPGTANTLMAAKLVHDLHEGVPAHDEPWRDEAWGAVHGGLWRQPYDPRSVLGIAVVLGWGSARA